MKAKSKIVLASLLTAVGGMVTELIPLLENLSYSVLSLFRYAGSVFKSLNLSFFGSRLLEYYNFGSGMSTNFVNVLFYFLLLVGAVLYSVRHQTETRLLRFAFSVILLCNVLYFLDRIFMFDRMLRFTDIALEWTLHQIKSAGLVYLSWWILQQLNSTRTLVKEGVANQEVLVKASRLQRLFNLLIDSLICTLIFSIFSKVYGVDLWQKIESGPGMQVTLFILLVVFRIIYYPFYETLFGATPGKFLTETRTVTHNGKPVGLNDTIRRTMSRFVPFEAFSFFGNDGWHDKWTYTQVVKEVPLGVGGSRYFLIIPVALALGAGGYFAYDQYEEHQRYLYSKSEHEQKVRTFEKEVTNITTNHFVKMREAKGYSSKKMYLKIENVEVDNLFASVFTLDEYAVTPVGVGEYYQERQELLNKVLIKKSDLLLAFTKDYEGYRSDKRTGVKLLSDGVDYEIDEIFSLYSTIINGSGGGSTYGSNIILNFKNCGWNGELIDIRNIEGSIKWTDALPKSIDAVSSKQYGCASFSVNGTNYEHGTDYIFELTIEDLANKKQKYRVEGVNLSTRIYKVDE